MPGPEFFQTTMGQRFYEGTVPKLTSTLERVADALEKVIKAADTEVDYPFDDRAARSQLLEASKKQTPDYEYYAKTAREHYNDEGTIEIDDEPLISSVVEDDMDGVYVQAWVWVEKKPQGESDAGD
jgi:hypothetical protein